MDRIGPHGLPYPVTVSPRQSGGAVIEIERGGWSDGEPGDGLVVGLLGVSEGEAAVNLEGLLAGVAAVGLDEGVVDALGLEPGEEEMAEPVGGHVVLEAGLMGVAGEHGPHPAGRVRLLPARLEQVGGSCLCMWSACRARASRKGWGNGTTRSLPPLPWVMRMRQASRSTSSMRMATSSATRAPV